MYFFQPQFAVEFGAEKNYWIPYSVGCLWSYVKQFKDIDDNYECKDLIFKREKHENILSRLESPVVCAFSCYQWNKSYNLALAEKIKREFPECIILFGGPEVTEQFLNNEYIDSIILGEGENSLLDLLRSILSNSKVLEVYYKSRVTDLATLPSPYAQGVFDRLVQDNPDIKWATTLETNRGCPFSCTFCDWGSLTYSKVKKFEMDRVAQDLDWIARHPISYVFCADANFGIFKDRDLEIAKMIKRVGEQNKNLEIFNATFNKNNNEWSFKILEELGELNRGFTVSVQSMHPDTLKAIKRDNLGINDLEKIFKLCQDNNVNSYTEVILGLPLETRESFVNGLCNLLELGQHNHVDIWFTDLLINSELSTAESRQQYKIKTVSSGNYLSLSSELDEYTEAIDIVRETSTMSTPDMIESFMYGWSIINLHMQGYTQLTSRYYNQCENISFRLFYDTLISNLTADVDIGNIFNDTKKNLENLLYNGILPPHLSGHNLMYCNSKKIFLNKHRVFDILDQTVKQLVSFEQYNPDIAILQKHTIFDVETQYPIELTANIDINQQFANQLCRYVIDKKISTDTMKNFDNLFYLLRRKGVLKNSIKLLESLN